GWVCGVSDLRQCAATARLRRPWRRLIPGDPFWSRRVAGALYSIRGSILFRAKGARRAPAPVLPGSINTVGASAGGYLINLPGSEELDLAHVQGLLLQARVHLQIDRNIHRVANGPADHGCSMTAHERGGPRSHQLREVAAHFHAFNQQCRIAEMIVGIPYRHFGTDWRAHMEDRSDRHSCHA